jgi:phosphate-selective porin OprO and OprP
LTIQLFKPWIGAWTLAWAGALAGWLPAASAQVPTPPLPSPTPGPGGSPTADASAGTLAERVRKLEEMNQRLLQQYASVSQQYQDVSKQNDALSRTVQDLSKRLEESTQVQGRQGPQGLASAVSGPGAIEPPIVGGLTSPPAPGVGAPKRKRRLFTRFYYDEDYRERYGYVFQSEDQEFELRFNGELQVDSRVYQNVNQTPVVSDMNIPRARLYFSGRLTKPLEYQLSFQRTNNSFDLLNAYLNFRYDERAQLRFGRFRAPFTYEWAKLSNWEMLQPERTPFQANFGPNRQIGLMGWGNIFENRLEYAVGIFDGPRNSYQDFNNSKDIMAFLDYRPFFQTKSALKFLSVGGSVDAGRENNPLVPAQLRGSANASSNTLATGSGDSLIVVPFLQFNNNVKEKGGRGLWELHATYFYKGLSVLGAWDSGFNDFALTTPNANPVHLPVGGYHVQLGYILTGETLEKRALVEPLRPFDLRRGKFGPGAIELQFRYSELEVGKQVFTGGLADPNLWTNRLNMTDLGFNWYLTKNIKFYFDWEHAMFAQPVYFRPGGLQATSDLYWMRLQLYY